MAPYFLCLNYILKINEKSKLVKVFGEVSCLEFRVLS